MTIVKRVCPGSSNNRLICNLSFQMGTFPNTVQNDHMVMQHWKWTPNHTIYFHSFHNFLKTKSKNISRIDNFADKHKLLYESRYRFRSQRSKFLAILELIDKITSSTTGLLVGLTKKFDTI